MGSGPHPQLSTSSLVANRYDRGLDSVEPATTDLVGIDGNGGSHTRVCWPSGLLSVTEAPRSANLIHMMFGLHADAAN